MNIDDTHKTLTLLGHFSISRVKSMTYRDVFIEWEQLKKNLASAK